MSAWTIERIRTLLTTNDRAVERAILALYDRQTTEEQRRAETRNLNDVGFNAVHGRRGVKNARQIMAGRSLSVYQLAWWRSPCRANSTVSRIGIYAGQLLEIAETRGNTR